MRRAATIALVLAVGVVTGALGVTAGNRIGGPPSAASADVGFLRDMVDHHEQAVLLSSLALQPERAAATPVRDVAVGIIASQRYELGLMEGWLRKWGHGRGATARVAMAWMGHGVPVPEMPGMASPGELQALTVATGPDFDAEFFRLMREHHEGGMHMGTEAAKRARDADVRWLANLMTRNQRREVREMEALRARLEPPTR